MFAFSVPDGPRLLRTAKGRVPRRARQLIRTQARTRLISGVTRDSNGAPLGGCTVRLYCTADNAVKEVVTSDASGAFTFSAINDDSPYYEVAVDPTGLLVGTTLRTLVGV